MSDFSVYEKFRCAAREARLRKKVFPKWIDEGKLTEEKAKWQIDCMEAIADDYHKQWQADGGKLPDSEGSDYLW
jgi:hypothetical protein